MVFISGESHRQIIMMPDYIKDSNAARVIEAYINRLDMAALGRMWQ
ncbi:MAG: hypothetical protein LBL20_01380 [Treponema sp.]|jgi:hypothetical protein|nr:hypothetical protein [Treponema sp.]